MHLHDGSAAGVEKTPIFSRDMSQMVKGVAILMMIAHHCFAFPDFWLDDFCVSAISAAIGNHFKICVAVFAFITGYGFFVGRSSTYSGTVKKTAIFLVQYWLQLFLIFLPVASASFSFSFKQILYNMAALNGNVVLFAWYVFFHCYVMLTFPVVKRILTKGPVWDLAMVLAGGYAVTVFFYFLPLEGPLFSMLTDCSIYYPVVGIGYLSAKYAVFDRFGPKLGAVAAGVLIPVMILLRMRLSVVKGFTFDAFYAPILILALCRILEKCQVVHPVLSFLGKHSFHMWLFHSIFFSAYTRDMLQPLVCWSDLPLLRFLSVTILSAAAAVLIHGCWNRLMQFSKYLFAYVRKRT